MDAVRLGRCSSDVNYWSHWFNIAIVQSCTFIYTAVVSTDSEQKLSNYSCLQLSNKECCSPEVLLNAAHCHNLSARHEGKY